MGQGVHQCGGLADFAGIANSSIQVCERGRGVANNP